MNKAMKNANANEAMMTHNELRKIFGISPLQ
jgi:hypothetical protein